MRLAPVRPTICSMLTVNLALSTGEAEVLAAILAAAAIDDELSEQAREAATKALREIERTRVAAVITQRKHP